MATKKLAAKTPAEPKFPKSLGACVDLLHETREKRLAMGKDVDAVKKVETAINDHIIDNLGKSDEKGAVGKHYKAIRKDEQVLQVEDWEKFYAYIKKNNAFELLNRALNKAAAAEHMEALNPPSKTGKKPAKLKLIPGTKLFTAVKLSVTKVG